MFTRIPRLLILQAGSVALAAIVAGLFGEVGTSLAVMIGGLAALANIGLLHCHWRKDARNYHCDAGRHLRSFYRSAMERFFVVVILLAAGFVLFKEHRLGLLAGFVVGQLAWMLASPTLRERN